MRLRSLFVSLIVALGAITIGYTSAWSFDSTYGGTLVAEADIKCTDSEIQYNDGCINAPQGEGKSLEEIGICPEGYFKYNGRCHRAPRDEDVRREPLPYREKESDDSGSAQKDDTKDKDSQPKTAREKREERCRTAYDMCVERCGDKGTALYNQCESICNVGMNTCMQQ